MICLYCSEPLVSPEAVRLTQGELRRFKWGVSFKNDLFEDDEKEKFLHHECAVECGILRNTLEDDVCRVCNYEIEPVGGPSTTGADCALKVEFGEIRPSKRGPLLVFIPESSGCVHYMCACDDWNLPLMNLYYERD